MTKTRVETKRLVEILTDLAYTSAVDGPNSGVLLHSARGYANPAEPGVTDLLVGTSTNGRHAGHTWCAANGQLPPMLWRLDDVHAVTTVLKAVSRGVKEHMVDILRDGTHVTVAEDPTLFGDTSMRITAAALDEYPRDLWRAMQGVGGKPLDEEMPARLDLAAPELAALARVARRRSEDVRTFRVPRSRRILIQIGDTYRGVVVARAEDSDDTEPDAEVYAPELPDQDEA